MMPDRPANGLVSRPACGIEERFTQRPFMQPPQPACDVSEVTSHPQSLLYRPVHYLAHHR